MKSYVSEPSTECQPARGHANQAEPAARNDEGSKVSNPISRAERLRPASGTGEWAKENVNIQTGCNRDCKYCYANYDQKTVRENLRRHDPASPLLVGQLTEEDVIRDAVQESYVENQFSLW